MDFKRVVYLVYYLKNLDLNKFKKFLNFAIDETEKSKILLLVDCIYSVLKYNISFLEYFQFGFYKILKQDRQSWAGTGFMYEYQLIMNPKASRGILDDKSKFYATYQPFMVHTVYSKEELAAVKDFEGFMNELPSEKIVFKDKFGKCGKGIQILTKDTFKSKKNVLEFMDIHGFDILETFIEQHSRLNELSPSGVNTVRIITQLNSNNEVDYLGARLRISVNSPVDNMAAGNLVASIQLNTGMVDGMGYYSDITKSPVVLHPITQKNIIGFSIPYWFEILHLTRQAALVQPQNKSIGWDVVITQNGPGLLEGNHDWCKLVWQLPVEKGLKNQLEKYL